ncbi:membrane protein [Gallibacterium genomosp. 2]|uniref:Membrane protein n=2 Tax=Gallibacterium TaxID=155493 RepID=U1GHZ3_9PAST|nr:MULTISPECIES: outer membrane protein transport protein [Gallibacterium]ERF77302.1 membrane protein [Gallibacterium anatis 12656/12]KGQ30155.1 membrane protein [Gallibacterium genomosp. 2]KGQ48334.1 membrane protein [Gallibacterium anatis]
MRLLSKTLLASLVAVASQGAFASAFQLHETSTSGLGRAYAGDAAVAENASVVATNPALMTFFKQPEISIGGIYVRPNIDLKGETFGNNADADNIATKEVLPYVYAVYPINDRFAVGGGVNVNYGLATEFNNSYNAGFFGGKTDLTTINFNLSGAYRVSNNFSVGVGVNAVYADAVVERRVGILNLAVASSLAQKAQDAAVQSNNAEAQQYAQMAQQAKTLDKSAILHKLEGDTWGYGWNVGAVYEFNENNRIGLSYHSHISLDFDGNYTTDIPSTLRSAFGVTSGNGTGSLKLPLPAYWEVAGYHRLVPKFAVTYSIKRTEWSRFKELYAHNGGNKLFQKDENFSDTTRIALGFIYDMTESLTLRAGIAHDETAVSQNYHSISIPDTDRMWYSFGTTYRFTPNLSVDAGYAFVKGKNLSFDEKQGSLKGTFHSKSTAHLFGLGLNYRF